MKWYYGENFQCYAPDNCCLFCRHCSDVYWDYTNGPYMFFCELKKEDWKTCDKFEVED